VSWKALISPFSVATIRRLGMPIRLPVSLHPWFVDAISTGCLNLHSPQIG
jgi:hypothetical protein